MKIVQTENALNAKERKMRIADIATEQAFVIYAKEICHPDMAEDAFRAIQKEFANNAPEAKKRNADIVMEREIAMNAWEK